MELARTGMPGATLGRRRTGDLGRRPKEAATLGTPPPADRFQVLARTASATGIGLAAAACQAPPWFTAGQEILSGRGFDECEMFVKECEMLMKECEIYPRRTH
jgi:hypothetical protein